MTQILELEKVSVNYDGADQQLQIVNDINLKINAGEVVCLVGESGSGKTITSLAVTRLTDYESVSISEGSIVFDGKRIEQLNKKELEKLRGQGIGMIFQNPMNALDPLFTIESQLIDTIRLQTKVGVKEAKQRALSLLESVGITDAAMRLKQYPFELSGGMLQRVMIAIAISCNPKLLIADEPTTALDVTIQMQILNLLKSLKKKFNMSVLLITHDFGVAASIADKIAVMYAGKIVEQGSVNKILYHPEHPYTQGLIRSVSSYESKDTELYSIPGSIPSLKALPTGCRFNPRCEFASDRCRRDEPVFEKVAEDHFVACWHKQAYHFVQLAQEEHNKPSTVKEENTLNRQEVLVEIKQLKKNFNLRSNIFSRQKRKLTAVDHVDLHIYQNETLGLVGESGCGKSTLGRLLVQLEEKTSGEIVIAGENLANLSKSSRLHLKQKVQVVFQDSAGAMNPRWKIEEIIGEPLRVHTELSKYERRKLIEEAILAVGLNVDTLEKFPHECSGGQQQRICIARAIILKPQFIILDEAVSALDVSVQAQIINLLKKLQRELGLTYLFIAHGLDAVKYISDRIGVMYLGKLMELAPASVLFTSPAHPYSKVLLDSNPTPHRNTEQTEIDELIALDLPSPINIPKGCRFHTRCQFASDLCKKVEPDFQMIGTDHFVACHYPIIEGGVS